MKQTFYFNIKIGYGFKVRASDIPSSILSDIHNKGGNCITCGLIDAKLCKGLSPIETTNSLNYTEEYSMIILPNTYKEIEFIYSIEKSVNNKEFIKLQPKEYLRLKQKAKHEINKHRNKFNISVQDKIKLYNCKQSILANKEDGWIADYTVYNDIYCDGCNENINHYEAYCELPNNCFCDDGIHYGRYTCTVCEDYDLCSECYKKGIETLDHSKEHTVIRLRPEYKFIL